MRPLKADRSRQSLFRGITTILLGLLAICWLGPSRANAEQVLLGQMPGKPKEVGFLAKVLMEPIGGNGYQPLHIQFNPLGKSFSAERRLTIQIRPRGERATDLDLQFEQDIVIDQGLNVANFEFYVPHYYRWERVTVRILEDGRLVEKGQNTFSLSNVCKSLGQRTSIGVLQPRDVKNQDAPWKIFPDLRSVVTVVGNGPLAVNSSIERLDHNSAEDLVGRAQSGRVQFRRISESNLHTNWIGYSQLDVILVPFKLLQRIETEQEEAMRAIRKWVAAGGNLWVYGVRPGLDTTPLLSSIKDLSTANKNQIYRPNSVAGSLKLNEGNVREVMQYNVWQGWYTQSIYGNSNSSTDSRKTVYDQLVKDKNPMTDTVSVDELAGSIQVGTYGTGMVLTLQQEDPFPGSFQLWKSVEKICSRPQLDWGSRNGIDVSRGHGNYWQWLIAAVGQPPVKSFVALNSLFALLIGPVLYYFLRKRDRLYLLYFFAPALALIVTVGLFLYALAKDGTQTRARARKVTWVDTENDCLVEQMHHTYFTVLGSGKGVKFDDQTAVYPYRHSPVVDGYYYEPARHNSSGEGIVRRSDSEMTLNGVFLPSRDQVQYLTLKPVEEKETIEFQTGANSVSILNHLDFPIADIIVCDKNGIFWHTRDVNPASKKNLESTESSIVDETLDTRVFPDPAEVPELRRNYRNRWVAMPNGTYGPMLEGAMLERRLARWKRQMPVGSFVAVADLREEDLAVDNVDLSQSAHVLFGKLP